MNRERKNETGRQREGGRRERELEREKKNRKSTALCL